MPACLLLQGFALQAFGDRRESPSFASFTLSIPRRFRVYVALLLSHWKGSW